MFSAYSVSCESPKHGLVVKCMNHTNTTRPVLCIIYVQLITDHWTSFVWICTVDDKFGGRGEIVKGSINIFVRNANVVASP